MDVEDEFALTFAATRRAAEPRRATRARGPAAGRPALPVAALLLACGCATSEVRDGASSPGPDAGVPGGARGDAGLRGDAPTHGGADASAVVDAAPGALPACPAFAGPSAAGLVTHLSVTEASGVAASRRNPGVLWVHNDSGDDARIYAISTSGGAIGTFQLGGATATDWEDIAIGPGPIAGTSYIYVGDVGDNGTSRATVELYRVAEPAVDASGSFTLGSLGGVTAFTLQYPDGPHNAETVMIDPLSGDVYVVAKSGNGVSPVFRAAAPLSSAGPITMTEVATLTFGVAPLAGNTTTTGGDISPAGDAIAIRTYDRAFLWRRAPGATIGQALATPPCALPLADEGQGESLGFAADGSAYYSLGEGSLVVLSRYARQ